MRKINISLIKKTVEELCAKANFDLRPDVLKALRRALKDETNRRAQEILSAIIKNAQLAKKNKLAICQDTGLPIVLLEIGQKVNISGGNLKSAISQAIASGYRKASLRNSVIADPLIRKNPQFGPAIIHTEIVSGEKIKITILPKGFGCENKSQLKMFLPMTGLTEIKKFIIEAVKKAGPDACPPYVVGVGIGGAPEATLLLAKMALLRSLSRKKPKRRIAALEKDLLQKINRAKIGPMGLGGKTTALAVNILTMPTHIAGLPVAINISCHALRSASKII